MEYKYASKRDVRSIYEKYKDEGAESVALALDEYVIPEISERAKAICHRKFPKRTQWVIQVQTRHILISQSL